MRESIGTLSEMEEDEFIEENIDDVIVIYTQEELLSFILEILDFGENIDSEEELEHNNSYRILSSLLKKFSVLTIAIERKYVDRTYRDSYYMHFSCKHGKYSRFVLLYHYPYCILVCQRSMKKIFDSDIELEKVREWEPFAGYDHNLFPPEKIKQKEYQH